MKLRWWLAVPFSLLITSSSLAHGPSRQRVNEKIEINAPIATVWEKISNFCAIAEWHPDVVGCSLKTDDAAAGTVRQITLKNGAVLTEKLVKNLPEKKKIQYMMQAPNLDALPVNTHGSIMQLSSGESTPAVVEWKGGFYRGYTNNDPPPELNDEAAVQAITVFYRNGLKKLKENLEK